MSTATALILFLVSLTGMAWASVKLTGAIGLIGTRFGISESLLGILIALGSDAPEYSSAVVALSGGNHDLGLGVVIGSNIFNLAGLLGLSAIIAGRLVISRPVLWFNGAVSLVVSAVATALVLQWLPSSLSALLLTVVIVPYVVFSALSATGISRLPLPAPFVRFLATCRESRAQPLATDVPFAKPTNGAWWWVVGSLVLIVVCSIGAVKSVVPLARTLGVSDAVVGTLILAALTSIPNVIAAIKLAQEGRGAAVVSESLNSNTINVLIGLCLPALVFQLKAPSAQIIFAVFWLLGMKILALLLANRRGGLRRVGGVVLVALYLVFATAIVLWRG